MVDRIRLESLTAHSPTTLIVGASGDSGEVGRELGARGERIALLSRDGAMLNGFRERLEHRGVECAVFEADVTESESVLTAFMHLSRWSLRLDRLIYNVGAVSNERAAEVSESELARVMGVNFFGFVNCFQLALPMFQRLGRGHVVTMSRATESAENEVSVAYAASRASLQIYVNALRNELAEKHVHFTDVMLGRSSVAGEYQELTCEEIVAGLLRVMEELPERFVIGKIA